MKRQYKQWIESYRGNVHLRCMEVVAEMKDKFPELIQKRGCAIVDVSQTQDAFIEDEKQEPHSWLVDPETEEIIDPTKSQWEMNGMSVIRYNTAPDGADRINRCCNCGKYYFHGRSTVCSDSCSREYASFLNHPTKSFNPRII